MHNFDRSKDLECTPRRSCYILQFLFITLGNLAMGCVALVYTTTVEVYPETTCFMPNKEADLIYADKFNDINSKFDTLLYIVGVLGIVEFLRGLSIILSIYVHSNFALVYLGFCLNECLGFATIVILHVFRF